MTAMVSYSIVSWHARILLHFGSLFELTPHLSLVPRFWLGGGLVGFTVSLFESGL